MIIKLNSKEKKYKVILSKKDWVAIGKEGGWFRTSQFNEEDDDVVFDMDGNPTWKSEVSPEEWEKAKYESEFRDLERDEEIEKMYEETNSLKEKFDDKIIPRKKPVQKVEIPNFIKARVYDQMYDVVKQVNYGDNFNLFLQGNSRNLILKIKVPNYIIFEGEEKIPKKFVQLFTGSSDSPEPFIFPINIRPKKLNDPKKDFKKDLSKKIKKERIIDDDADMGPSSNYNRQTLKKLLGFTIDGEDYFITSKKEIKNEDGFFTGHIIYKVKSNDGKEKIIKRKMDSLPDGDWDFIYLDENNREINPELIERTRRNYRVEDTEVSMFPYK